MNELLQSIALDTLAVLIPIAVTWLIAYVNKKIGTEKLKQVSMELDAKQGLSYDIVNFVEQVYKDLQGPEKFNKALELFAAQAKAKGFTVTPDELHVFIESAVKIMNDAVKAAV